MRRDDVHADPEVGEEAREFRDVVAVAEAEARGAEDVAVSVPVRGGRVRGEVADDLEEGLVRAEVLLAG